MNIPKIEEAITLLYQTYIEDQDVVTQRGIAITAMNEMVKLLGGEDVVTKIEAVPYSAGARAQHLFEDVPQRKPLTNGEIYTAYITATNQTLRAQDERLALAFARAIEAAHGIK